MISDPLFYLIAIPAVFIVGLAKSGFGGGMNLMAVPLMSLIISPVQAAAIMLPLLIAMDIGSLYAWRGVYDRRSLINLLPPAVLGIAIGWAGAAYISDAWVRLIVGVISVLFVLDHWIKPAGMQKPAAHHRGKGGFCGAISGFTSFLSHSGGPLFQIYMLPLRLEPKVFAGTAIIYFAVVNAVKVIPYLALGQFTTANLSTSLVLLPVVPLGIILGFRIVHWISVPLFYKILYAFLFPVGIKLIWDGATGL